MSSMRDPLAVGAVGAVAAVAVALAGGAGAAAGQRSCGPASAQTLADNGIARIYTAATQRRPAPAPARVYGCVSGSTKVVSLGGGNHQYVEHATLGGHFAGYALRSMGVDNGSTRVRVTDLRSGRMIDDTAATSPFPRPESFTAVTALVLNTRGHVAWVGSKSAVGASRPTYEVRKIDSPAEALLDAGPDIGPRSLRLRGTQLSWSHGRGRRTARLA
jgi:hypothetical protein